MAFYTAAVDKLVPAAKTFATQSNQPLIQRYPQLQPLAAGKSLGHWNFVMTVAGAGTALWSMTGSNKIPAPDKAGIHDSITNHLRDVHAGAPGLLAELTAFLGKQHGAGIPAPMALGNWVVNQLKKGPPTPAESEPAKNLGLLLFKQFAGWWDAQH